MGGKKKGPRVQTPSGPPSQHRRASLSPATSPPQTHPAIAPPPLVQTASSPIDTQDADAHPEWVNRFQTVKQISAAWEQISVAQERSDKRTTPMIVNRQPGQQVRPIRAANKSVQSGLVHQLALIDADGSIRVRASSSVGTGLNRKIKMSLMAIKPNDSVFNRLNSKRATDLHDRASAPEPESR
ncbi:hypothetical protein U1Q18_049428 [Sarracenia purpurea var. burkii]